MKREQAKILVKSLVGRLEPDGAAFKLPGGILSKDEVTALKWFGDVSPAKTTSESFEDKGVQTQLVSINRNAFDAVGPPEDEIRLCLDFGTAMSKAWAGRHEDDDTIPLVLGQIAGTGDTLVLPSSIYISQSGRIYFGASAETQHRQEIETGRQRFDNLKQMLSESDLGQELDDVPLSLEIDPTQSGLSKGDLLVLYLAWLTDLALKSLENTVDGVTVSGSLRYVRRRFAIPCFEHAQDETVGGDERAEWATSVMERALLRAQIVADSLTDSWADLTVEYTHSLMVECRSVDKERERLLYLLAERAPVREPVAAGASRFNDMVGEEIENISNELVRRMLLVVDAGAGTTDFAFFQTFQKHLEEIGYALISPSVKMCRVAGNAVDSIIRPMVLEACNIDPQSGHPRSEEEFSITKISLNSLIRDIKHDLFEKGEVKIELRPNVSGTLKLTDVLASNGYKELGKQLCQIRNDVIRSVFSSEHLEFLRQRLGPTPCPIHVLLTGGSSTLPIVRDLAVGNFGIDGVSFCFSPVIELPDWINRLPRQTAALLTDWYPQCAVAIGGTVSELPEEKSDQDNVILPPQYQGPIELEKY